MLLIENLDIRQARPDDVSEAIPLIYSSGPAEFEYGFTHSGYNAQAFMAFAFQSTKGLFSYRNHYVALLAGEIVGIGAFYSNVNYAKCSRQLVLQILHFYPFLSWFGIIRNALNLQSVIPSLPQKTFYLADFGVKEPYRSQGIGRAIIAYGKSLALANQLPSYMLDVSMSNLSAQQLYEREGFSVINEYRFRGEGTLITGSRRMRMFTDDQN